MEAIREITVWSGASAGSQPNHDYLLEGNRILAYRPWGTDEIRRLSGNIKLDRRGRKFIKLDTSLFKELAKPKTQPVVIEIKGSKGNSYFVNVEEKTCTCPGYQFRGKCKHVDDL